MADISNFYLGTPMKRVEYMCLPMHIIPHPIINQYNLTPLVHKDKIYMEIQKGMYGLPQAGLLAHEQLVQFLAPHG